MLLSVNPQAEKRFYFDPNNPGSCQRCGEEVLLRYHCTFDGKLPRWLCSLCRWACLYGGKQLFPEDVKEVLGLCSA